MSRLLSAVTAAIAVLAIAGPAAGDDRMPAERWTIPYSASPQAIPRCDNPSVLSRIQTRFAEMESEYWDSAMTIAGFERVRPIGFRPWGLDFVPRLFCTGTALMADGRRHQVDYSVVEDASIIGWSWGVEWCVNGYDHQRAYSPSCKMARP